MDYHCYKKYEWGVLPLLYKKDRKKTRQM